MKTKYKFGSVKRLLGPENSDADFVTNFRQIIKIINKTFQSVVIVQPLCGVFSETSANLVAAIGGCRRKPPPRSLNGRL